MDQNPDQSREDEPADLSQRSENDSTGIVPLPGMEPTAPPRDIDERGERQSPDEPIQLPDSHGWEDTITDEIDEHQPLPVEGEYHDDDAVAPDPYDVDDQVDLHMPLPTRDPANEVDDASTGEELDVDTAPGMRGDTIAPSDRVRFASAGSDEAPSGDRVYTGHAGDDPVNQESDLFSQSTGEADASRTPEGDPGRSPGTTAAGTPTGETICPVCGRQTDALHFCGYCGAPLTENRRALTSATLPGRLLERAERLLDPVGHWTRPGGVRFIMAAGGLLVLLALLANSGALALMIGAAILPLILVYWCLHSDVFENEPWPILLGVGAAGVIVGAILGWLSSLIVDQTWFDTGVLNYGAAGLGGNFAQDAGSPPFLAWFMAGIVFPVLALAAIIGVPLALRQTVSLRNEMMDGLTLGAIMGAGISLGTAIAFAAPMTTRGGPVSDASTWTLTVIGLTITRPLVWTLCGGLLGVATWQYMLTSQIGRSIIPAVIGAGGVLLFAFVSIQISASGLWAEIVWGLIVAIVVGFFYMSAMRQAIAHDRRILGNDDSRVECPHCHLITPNGQFCAHCGQPLGNSE
ncbi:MAG TPA: hypothetical protein VNZ58_07100 [Thermomicrobiales bacterium]|nr:hypothetical protein [Thermomicrobiales bacterium]